jgi:hypothetical protein
MNRLHQPRTLLVLGHTAGMGTAAAADEARALPRGGWRQVSPDGTTSSGAGGQLFLVLCGYLARQKPPTPLGTP